MLLLFLSHIASLTSHVSLVWLSYFSSSHRDTVAVYYTILIAHVTHMRSTRRHANSPTGPLVDSEVNSPPTAQVHSPTSQNTRDRSEDDLLGLLFNYVNNTSLRHRTVECIAWKTGLSPEHSCTSWSPIPVPAAATPC